MFFPKINGKWESITITQSDVIFTWVWDGLFYIKSEGLGAYRTYEKVGLKCSFELAKSQLESSDGDLIREHFCTS